MLQWQISAGHLFEVLRPAAFLCAALASTWTLSDARRRQFSTHAVALWAAATLAFPFIAFPLYLIFRNCGLGKSRRQEAGAGGRKRQDVADSSCLLPPAPLPSIRLPQWALPLLYLLLLLAFGAFYFYRDYYTFDAHLARAANAKLHNGRARVIGEYRAALRLKDDPHTHKLLGLELAAEERLEEALAELRAAERGGDPDESLPYHLATTLDALGRTAEAVTQYRKFLQSDLCAQPPPDLRCIDARLRAQAAQ